MGNRPRDFAALPNRAINDTRFSALDLRCFVVIAFHDGMSGVRGKGSGCFARRETLASEAETDPTNFSKSLERLVEWGYVVREQGRNDKRRFILRVVYGDDAPRLFVALPIRLNRDRNLSALDIRCLAAIARHDNRSLSKGTGPGCFATNVTLAMEVGIDATNFSKSLSRLFGGGYVVREQRAGHRRGLTTLRVIYDADDGEADAGDGWANDQPSSPRKVAKRPTIPSEIGGEAESKNSAFSRQNDRQETSLSERRDFVKTSRRDAVETAQQGCGERSADRGKRKSEPQSDGAEAPAAGGVSLYPHLPRDIRRLGLSAQLVCLERAINAIGGDASLIDPDERKTWARALNGAFNAYGGEADGYHALRLIEQYGFELPDDDPPVSIYPLLPANFDALSIPRRMTYVEDAFATFVAAGGNTSALGEDEFRNWSRWLSIIAHGESFPKAARQRALRLLKEWGFI
jgi:DNA-binding MarR family transcriptional regulator